MTDTEELTEEKMLQIAHDLDSGKVELAPEATPAPDAPAETAAKEVAKAESKPKEDAVKANVQDKVEAKPAETAPQDEKPKSKYAQNQERLGKTWQEVNAEKNRVAAEKAAIAAEKQALSKAKEELQAAKSSTEPYRDSSGFTAKDYAEAAEKFTAEGNKELAEQARRASKEVADKEVAFRQEQQTKVLHNKWNATFEELKTKNPELGDQSSDLHKAVVSVLKDARFKSFVTDPDGLASAFEIAQMRTQLAQQDGTKAELAKIKSEYEALLKKTQIKGGSPTGEPGRSKDFSEMTDAEQKAHLFAHAATADSEMGF